jgi:hypothetical protein
MHKMRSIAAVAAAVILADAAGLISTTTHAQAPVGVGGINPVQITMNAKKLPAEECPISGRKPPRASRSVGVFCGASL